MTGLLEIKEKLKMFYSKGEIIILPVAKFLLAFVALNALNSKIGYMTQVNNIAVVLIVALLCSLLSPGVLVFFATVISLAHMYALSMEVALVGLCVYLVMYLLFFRFSPNDALVVLITPLLCYFNIPYVVPLAVGLLCGPSAVVSVGCGLVVHYMTDAVVANATNIKTMGDEEALAKIRLMIESILGNKAMLVMIAGFAITMIVVYLIRRMRVDYAWTIAIVAGALTEAMIILIGDLILDINISVAGVLVGALLAALVGKVIEFFRFCVDYSRTERVQFEDDEYYYYVKAVPKMSVTMSTKTVKRINSQQAPAESAGYDRNVQQGRTAQAGYGSRMGRTSQATAQTGRNVTTERTANGAYGSNSRNRVRAGEYRSGKSVTIGNATATSAVEDNADEYDSLYDE